jgi:hypothetical protein
LGLEGGEIDLLADFDEVGVGDIVGFGDVGVFVGVSVEVFGNFR